MLCFGVELLVVSVRPAKCQRGDLPGEIGSHSVSTIALLAWRELGCLGKTHSVPHAHK